MSPERLSEITRQFDVRGIHSHTKEIKNGHVNTTYLVTFRDGNGTDSYILQSVSKYVFKEPVKIMENVAAVTKHIKHKAELNAEDPDRATLTFLDALDGKNYYIDDDNVLWRMYKFIDKSITYDFIDNLGLLTNAGYAFGNFQRLLSDFPINSLHETIPDFHNTKKRIEAFFNAVKDDPCGRVKDIKEHVKFFEDRAESASRLIDMVETGKIPLRVTHNDTKYNNVLFDETTGKPICVIDLDTVMPGLSAYDFGDAIRFAASSAEEDETDLSKVYIDLDFYKAFTQGFLGAAKGFFSPDEIESMPWGARIITLELASRFLMDYINGDKYFRIHHPGHNLERALNQMKLVLDMEAKFDEMQELAVKYALADMTV
jgi:hypothetical protein